MKLLSYLFFDVCMYSFGFLVRKPAPLVSLHSNEKKRIKFSQPKWDTHFPISYQIFCCSFRLNQETSKIVFVLCPCVAVESRGRPPPGENQRLQSLHSAVHHPGTWISHHQPGHRWRQVETIWFYN